MCEGTRPQGSRRHDERVGQQGRRVELTRNRNGTMMIPPETNTRRDRRREEDDLYDEWLSWTNGQIPRMPETAAAACSVIDDRAGAGKTTCSIKRSYLKKAEAYV